MIVCNSNSGSIETFCGLIVIPMIVITIISTIVAAIVTDCGLIVIVWKSNSSSTSSRLWSDIVIVCNNNSNSNSDSTSNRLWSDCDSL